MAARKVEDGQMTYIQGKTKQPMEYLKAAKRQLLKEYDRLIEDNLETGIRAVKRACDDKKEDEAWRIVNKISGRKQSKAGQVNINTSEDRVQTWFENVNIADGPCTMAELQKLKHFLKLGKCAGPDEIPPEVF